MMAESMKIPFDSPDWIFKSRLQQGFASLADSLRPKEAGNILVLSYSVLIPGGHYGYADSGFTEKGLKGAVEKMKPLFTDKCPFVNPPSVPIELSPALTRVTNCYYENS
jgi:hypothetical protein